MIFATWRNIHRVAAGIIGVLGLLHTGLTFVIYDSWSPGALWFAGTGLSLVFLAAANWSHVGLGPCEQPTAPVIRYANVAYFLFGIAAVVAIPEPQAYVLLAAFMAQAIAGFVTLKAGRGDHTITA